MWPKIVTIVKHVCICACMCVSLKYHLFLDNFSPLNWLILCSSSFLFDLIALYIVKCSAYSYSLEHIKTPTIRLANNGTKSQTQYDASLRDRERAVNEELPSFQVPLETVRSFIFVGKTSYAALFQLKITFIICYVRSPFFLCSFVNFFFILCHMDLDICVRYSSACTTFSVHTKPNIEPNSTNTVIIEDNHWKFDDDKLYKLYGCCPRTTKIIYR